MHPSNKAQLLAFSFGLATLAGCQSNQQFLQQNQAAAIQTTLSRATFELNCKDVQTTLLSSKVSQPVVWGGYERTEYTIGARGCGRQAVYITWCLDPNTCNAINDSTTFNPAQ